MAAVIGNKNVMSAAQDTFISSTYWTDKIGPAAALATIKKLKRNKVPKYLAKIGRIVQNGWREAAAKHKLKIEISGIYPLSHFSFNCKNPQVLKTLFTQRMLGEGFLATNVFYASFAHKEIQIKKYLKAVDRTFGFISKVVLKGNEEDYLKGPVCHSGFRRLA